MYSYEPFSLSAAQHQPNILENIFNSDTLFQGFVFFVFFGYLAFVYAAESLYRKSSDKAKRDLIVFSPLWLSALAIIFILNLVIIASNQAGFLLLVLTVAIGYPLFYVYYLVAAWTANMGYVALKAYQDASKSSLGMQEATSYSLLSAIKNRRSIWFLILAIVTTAVLFLDAMFFPAFNDPLPLFLGFIGAIFYLIVSLIKANRISIPEVTGHPKESDFKNAVEKVAIRTGIKEPSFKVLKHTNPTIFSIQDISGKVVVCITAPLLNMSDKNELEALVSHEFAHIMSGRVVFLEILGILLSILRAGGFLLLFFILWSIHPFLIAIWFALIVRILISSPGAGGGERGSFAEVIFNFLNPPYLFISFLSNIIYYSLAETEEFYADAKAIELTRYPKALHSVINKIENYKGNIEELPENFSTHYFSAENNPFSPVPTFQPTAEEREQLIEGTDRAANDPTEENRENPMACPSCKSVMAKKMIEAKAGNLLKAWHCPNCDGFWMDSWDMMCIKNLPVEKVGKNKKPAKGISVCGDMFCPCCGIKLEESEKGKNLRECSNCRGVFGTRKDLENFFNKK